MPRVKRGVHAKKGHKKVLARAKGYYGGKSRLYRSAKGAGTRRPARPSRQLGPSARSMLDARH